MTSDKALLVIVEDDIDFAQALRRAFVRRNYDVEVCPEPGVLHELLERRTPDNAVVDLKLSGHSGLECVRWLRANSTDTKIVVLTGYASIATAIEAIKLGASYYLAKPANADDIEAAFQREEGDPNVDLGARPSSIKTVEWEHIHRTLAETGFNISETARRLGMHRRTLARKLMKQQVK